MNYLETLGFVWIIVTSLLGTAAVVYACVMTLRTAKRQILRGAVEEIADCRDAQRMRDDTDWAKRLGMQ